MKKILAMMMTLCLLLTGMALAEEAKTIPDGVEGIDWIYDESGQIVELPKDEQTAPKPTKVTLADSKTVTVYMGTPVELDYTVSPEGADASLLKWSSSSKKIAKVENGVVTPVKEGTATITVKAPNGKKDTVKVKVVDPYKPSKVVLDKEKTVTMNMGETLQLNAALQPETAQTKLKWSTSSKKVATVDENGVVTPVKEGTATITVKTANGKKDTVKVKVVDPYKPSKVVLDQSGTVMLSMGERLELNAALQPETAKTTLKWSTSSKKIATVDENGVVTPVKEGAATITVKTVNGKKDTVKVKVVDPYKPSKVVLDQSGTVTLEVGKTLQLNAALAPETARTTLKWKSSSAKVAKVDENGLVTAVKAGTATITVTTANGKKDTVKVKVAEAPWTPNPDYKELKEAIRYGDSMYWGNDHPVVKAISGIRYIDQDYDDKDSNPSYYNGRVIWGTNNVKLCDYDTGLQLLLEEGAPYTIFGFTPGMTIQEVNKNFSQRSDIKKEETRSFGDGLKYILASLRVKMVYLKPVGEDDWDYLDLWIGITYDPKTDLVKRVTFDYFWGA